ncbi:Phosphonoacetate hydrolase [Microthyrium microscopicum]|uniref:Phosphonoacetate hydrolase n=1 Tax=Microthyrium microscopicum TaxID=703497 RepID=A0A6A6UAE4_9PEZI|nr:Phosphonoacetate hydrolase [Microthyrium microscopicum]
MSSQHSTVTIHGRTYNLPTNPTVIVCVDGFDPEYLERGIAEGILPTMEGFVKQGFHQTAQCAMPSLTNPNNVSIITGVPTAIHGISGNFFLDRETGKEEMILDDKFLWGSTILEFMSKRGVRVAAITAKDKLRLILKHGLEGAICFSSQYAKDCTVAENGIDNVEEWVGRSTPSQYSGDLSIFVLDAGIRVLQEKRADLLYLTLSDFIQHKHAPGSKESNEFLSALDNRLGEMVKLGATVAVTGDHGMSDKAKADGTPMVLFLEDALEAKFGKTKGFARVICPITDPFVKHHGALGGFVRLYINDKSVDNQQILDFCKSLPQVEAALTGKEAAAKYEMPLEREGDFVVISKENAVIGTRKEEHDLSSLKGHRLRSHGGLSEQAIPLLKSIPTDRVVEPGKVWRNFDIFDLALNP